MWINFSIFQENPKYLYTENDPSFGSACEIYTIFTCALLRMVSRHSLSRPLIAGSSGGPYICNSLSNLTDNHGAGTK